MLLIKLQELNTSNEKFTISATAPGRQDSKLLKTILHTALPEVKSLRSMQTCYSNVMDQILKHISK